MNEAKSTVARPQERKFLGFSFRVGPEVKRVIAPKALDRFKHRIREITRRAKSVSLQANRLTAQICFPLQEPSSLEIIRGSGRGAKQAGYADGADCVLRLMQMKALLW